LQPEQPTLARRAGRKPFDPLSILLLIAGTASLLVLRDVPEGVAILTILAVNVVVGFSQEARADQAARALR
jgi:P-type Ca2+ transporter type 2C